MADHKSEQQADNLLIKDIINSSNKMNGEQLYEIRKLRGLPGRRNDLCQMVL